MAFSVRLTGFGCLPGKPLLQMEPPWWPVQALKEDPRMRESVGDGYLDYRASLSVAEARAMHERLKPEACRGVLGTAPWQDVVRPMMVELDAVFGSRAGEFAEFEVRVFEWESGLGET
jgi:hypothetical protein